MQKALLFKERSAFFNRLRLLYPGKYQRAIRTAKTK